jgi:acetyl-CoA synthetase
VEAYGQTETLMTVANYAREPMRPGSMGRPLPGTSAAVLDEAGNPLPAGRRGELAIGLPNPQVMLGYWNEPQRTAATRTTSMGREYFLTGDLVTMDADGYLFYEGRTDDIISSAGYRIGPMEIENALIEHPAVLESAAVASPDAERGEIVKAFVVLRPGHRPSAALATELQEHVKQATAPYKYPRAVEFVADLPKTATGKIMRRMLKNAELEKARKA